MVISPLISLMKDQVQALNQAGVHAAYINSSLTEGQIQKAMEYAMGGRYKIIYVAPERLETWDFICFAQRAQVSMVAVDEAHCISQWVIAYGFSGSGGHDAQHVPAGQNAVDQQFLTGTKIGIAEVSL